MAETKYLASLIARVRQFLRDELVDADTATEFEEDELKLHIGHIVTEVSQRSPYEVRETVVSDGTQEISIASISDLIGDKVIRVEYPVGNDPPSYLEFTKFGSTLTLTGTTPTSGENIYLYCHKLHSVTETSMSLSADLERVVIEGAVANAAQAWLNKMRDTVVPSSVRVYQAWVDRQLGLYRNSLNSISKPKVWQY